MFSRLTKNSILFSFWLIWSWSSFANSKRISISYGCHIQTPHTDMDERTNKQTQSCKTFAVYYKTAIWICYWVCCGAMKICRPDGEGNYRKHEYYCWYTLIDVSFILLYSFLKVIIVLLVLMSDAMIDELFRESCNKKILSCHKRTRHISAPIFIFRMIVYMTYLCFCLCVMLMIWLNSFIVTRIYDSFRISSIWASENDDRTKSINFKI